MKPLVLGIGYLVMPKHHKSVWLRNKFEDSGPMYIKLGQFMSHRKDIFGQDLSLSMSSLKDKVKPVPWELLEDKVNSEYFQFVDPEPVATASIAQVHKATLYDGTQVALKIKKPDVDKNFEKELSELSLLCMMFPSINNIIGEFKKSIDKELDFKQEISNLKEFYKMYEYSTRVTIPRVYEEYSTDDVIVMKFISSDCVKPKAKILIGLFIEQLLYESYIHGDLHSGNIGTLNGSTVMYDFGNVIKTSKKYRRSMRDFIVALQSRDAQNILITMKSMGINVMNEQTSILFIEKFFTYIDTIDIQSFTFNPGEIEDKIPMTLDPVTTSILRSYSLLEGYCKKIDKSFSYEDILRETLEILILDSLI